MSNRFPYSKEEKGHAVNQKSKKFSGRSADEEQPKAGVTEGGGCRYDYYHLVNRRYLPARPEGGRNGESGQKKECKVQRKREKQK